MTEQIIRNPLTDILLPRGNGATPGTDVERLANVREEFSRVLAAADGILEGIRQQDSTKFLQQVRQAGGQ